MEDNREDEYPEDIEVDPEVGLVDEMFMYTELVYDLNFKCPHFLDYDVIMTSHHRLLAHLPPELVVVELEVPK